jgi:adenylate cyclase
VQRVRVERRLAAILAVDVAGYSRLMGVDEEGTHERLKVHLRQLVDPKIKEHHGRVVKNTGDGMLAEFASVVDAVRCAAEIQRGMIDRELEVTDDRRIKFRMGINLGDVMADGGDIFGDGVNVAARLEALAEPGGICVSRTVLEHIHDKLPYRFEDLGEHSLKNIARPVRVYRMRPGRNADSAGVASRQALPLPDKPSIAVLPFANMSGDPDQEFFADGIAEDVITALSKSRSLFVIARNSTFTYKGKTVAVKDIGCELGVRYVLEGSVRKSGNRVRVTRSWSKPLPAATSGPTGSIATSPTSSQCRTKSLRTSPPQSGRRSSAVSANAPRANCPKASTPGNATTAARGITPMSIRQIWREP